MAHRTLISFGIPCFNEELNVARTYSALTKIAAQNKKYDYEYILVDNGSTDETREEIRKLTVKNKNVTGVFLSKNFGPEASVQAIIDFARGDALIAYDCDMQDPPEVILTFIKKWEEGYKTVIGIRTKTEDVFLMSLARKAFYRIFKKVSDVDIPVDAGTFALIDRKAIDALKMLPEKYRFYRGLRAWIGFRTAYVRYERKKRKYGRSSYNILNYFSFAIRSLVGFSYLPLNFTIYFAILLLVASFIFICIFLLKLLLYGIPVTTSTTIIFLIIFFGGAQLLAISVVGKYIQVIIEETKNRPVYIIDEIINKKKQK